MRLQMLAFARFMLGTLYIWGGEQREGVDCSGLEDAGADVIAPDAFPGRQTAQDWANILPPTDKPQPGDTCYWGADWKHVRHMAVVEHVNGDLIGTIGAHGGDSTTTTPEIAKRKGAMVKRLNVHRSKLLGFRAWPTKPMPVRKALLPDIDPDGPDRDSEPGEDWV